LGFLFNKTTIYIKNHIKGNILFDTSKKPKFTRFIDVAYLQQYLKKGIKVDKINEN
tara:strand:+ start:1361 stop:1528 length:168 start_codon:yes stop_codon:yes gene_type:complete